MLKFQKYDFICTWTSNAFMPAYWGSAVRGGLGKWLRKVSCILRAGQCGSCAVRPSCAYGYVFETEAASLSGRSTVNARPHPIVLEFPFPCDFSTREGGSFRFSILLFDRADEFLPHIVYAFLKFGQEDGLGARSRQGYGRFEIASIECGGETVFSRDAGELRRPEKTLSLDWSGTGIGCHRLQVDYQTPFRVKHGGRFVRKVPFHVLIRAAIRRVTSLEAAYGPGEPELDYRSLVQDAEKVQTVQEELTWREVPRYSSRQRQKMIIGGPVGKVVYEGELGPFLPLLSYCEIVHLGKQTFFGLGKIRVCYEEQAA